MEVLCNSLHLNGYKLEFYPLDIRKRKYFQLTEVKLTAFFKDKSKNGINEMAKKRKRAINPALFECAAEDEFISQTKSNPKFN